MMAKRSTLCGIVSVFFIFLLTGCALGVTDNVWNLSSEEDSWNSFQEIVVTENAGKTLQGYPIPVNLNSSNFNFSEAKSDGSDIRFSSGDRTLNYWIETWDPENEEALIWVRLPSLPANKTGKILLRYGNPDAEAVSSGEKTFDFFDDFEGSNLNELYWSVESAGGGLVEVKNGICNVAAPKVHAYDSSTIYSKKSFDINSMFVVKRMKVTTGTDNRGPLLRQGFVDQIDSRKNEIKHETELANESRVNLGTTYRKQKNTLRDITDVNVPEGEWYVSGIAWYEENDTRKVSWFKNGVRNLRMDFVSNDYITNFPMHVYLYAASYQDASKNTGYMAVDYVLVRKFVGTEPTVRIISVQGEDRVSSESISKNNSEILSNDNYAGLPENSPENNSENVSDNNSEATSATGVSSQPGTLSEPQAAPGSGINSEASATERIAQTQENLSQNETGAQELQFPEYDVEISAIRLSSPYRFDFSDLVKKLDSSHIDTIFLSVDGKDVWQYERFVKMAHEAGISVHAVLLEDINCTERGADDACQDSLNMVLDYNEKSLAPFDGVNIYVNSSAGRDSEEDVIGYRTLFETASKEAKENISISASLPLNYTASRIEEIAPFVDSFVIRAYPAETGGLNSVPGIVDSIALGMGEIRGAGSKGIIEISVEEGFKDEFSIQELFAGLADYYSTDSAFLGVSIFNYDTYTALPRTEPDEKGFPIPGFKALPVLLAGLGAFALLKLKRLD
ncbi:DUF2341 domain-containing protein [Methanosarcina sp. MSH10X1]|uniref:DUF2341 domain-containing protein n=1 Tax=Methanosarcina sp. MSH10X1 TaxID=2507075 RepID=UPI000FFB77D8|nr:DUF2341 domain-containing protein [Methanosarcina sp. MSH10X1]RXA21382.1 DUF2341 domain-containing protein [Methanosarcina sp. MSH10X1]